MWRSRIWGLKFGAFGGLGCLKAWHGSSTDNSPERAATAGPRWVEGREKPLLYGEYVPVPLNPKPQIFTSSYTAWVCLRISSL